MRNGGANMKGTDYGNRPPWGRQVKKIWGTADLEVHANEN